MQRRWLDGFAVPDPARRYGRPRWEPDEVVTKCRVTDEAQELTQRTHVQPQVC